MVTNYLQGLKDAGITGCIKHFPGHGDTKADTHFGYASTQKTWAEMMDCEMVTFKAGIKWGCQLIMTAHIGAPKVTGSDIPSTLSSVVLQDKLRGELGYQNIIITDGMEMGAMRLSMPSSMPSTRVPSARSASTKASAASSNSSNKTHFNQSCTISFGEMYSI